MTETDISGFRIDDKFNGKGEIQIPARRENFCTLRTWLNSILDELSLPPKASHQILMSADEVFSNIVKYAYASSEGETRRDAMVHIEVEFDRSESCFVLRFVDSGIPFNPLEATPPRIDLPPEDRPVGGLGIFLVRKTMDFVQYFREEGRNVLVFKKRIVEQK